MLNHSKSAFSLFTRDGALLLQNPAAEQLFMGVGALLARFASESDGRALLRHLEAGGQVVNEQYALHTRGGTRLHCVSAHGCVDPLTREPAFVFEARPIPGDDLAESRLPFSERRFRQLCMRLPIGIYETSPQGELIFANPRWWELAGINADEALGHGWHRAVHPEDLERILATSSSHGARESDACIHFRFRHPSGESRWVIATNMPQRDEAGTVVGYLGAVIDVTESVESEQQFALVFEQSTDAHLLLDVERAILDCNQSALRLLAAKNKAQLLSRTLDEVSPPEQPNGSASRQALDRVQRELAVSGTCRFEWSHRRFDGTIVPTEVALTLLTLQGQDRMFMSIRDTTEREREREVILRSREAALEASRAKSQFLANMSHEIRTPMHGVLGMLSLALGTPLTPEQQEFIVNARSSAENLLDIINDILDLSKLEAGKLSIETLDVELETLLSAALRTTSLRAQAKGIEVSVEVGANVPAKFVGDAVRLRQVLINLVGNAVKFTQMGHILISISVVDASLRFTVEDTGTGISQARQELVFEAFQQADNSGTRRYGGTGLGLTISKELVERMGGKIELTSVEGQGSTFAFTIPLLPARASLPSAAGGVDLRGSTVLVLHVNAMARRVLAAALEQRGARVLRAASVSDATRLLQLVRDVRAAFVDHRLDDANNALELPGKLRDYTSCARTRWVLLRSTERIGRKELADAGFAYALDKPLLPSELDRALTESLDDTPSKLTPRPSLASEKKRHTLNVLVVEDHPVNAHFMIALLTRWGHHVVHAWNGQSALAVMSEQSFDVVMMDKHMPVMDGLETTRRIRQREAGGDTRVPIIALTASAMKGDQEECLAAGMDYYLDKPVVIETLDRVLTRVGSVRNKLTARIPTSSADKAALAAPSVEQPAFSREALLARACGDTRFQADLIQVFLGSQEEMMSGVEQALGANDPYQVRHAAHRLKGGLQLVCAEPAAQAALALEKAAREGDSSQFAQLTTQLRYEVSRLRAALGDFRADG
jgi:PAS domain S-box-containing protein